MIRATAVGTRERQQKINEVVSVIIIYNLQILTTFYIAMAFVSLYIASTSKA